MFDFLTPVVIVGLFVWLIYRIFELFVRRKERMALIEKLYTISNQDVVMQELKIPLLVRTKQDDSSLPLRISLLMIGVGLGIFLALFIMTNSILSSLGRNERELVIFSCIAIFGGLGLFFAYIIERSKNKKEDKNS